MIQAKVNWNNGKKLPSIVTIPSSIGKENAVAWLQDNYGGIVEAISFADVAETDNKQKIYAVMGLEFNKEQNKPNNYLCGLYKSKAKARKAVMDCVRSAFEENEQLSQCDCNEPQDMYLGETDTFWCLYEVVECNLED